LLPDGTLSELSVSPVLAPRNPNEPPQLVRDKEEKAQLPAAESDEREPDPIMPSGRAES
jgi:hypothetical protein